MSARREFLRSVLLAAAVSLLPKILRPTEADVVDERYVAGVDPYRNDDIVALKMRKGNIVYLIPKSFQDQQRKFEEAMFVAQYHFRNNNHH
jgi:hypothetical protein